MNQRHWEKYCLIIAILLLGVSFPLNNYKFDEQKKWASTPSQIPETKVVPPRPKSSVKSKKILENEDSEIQPKEDELTPSVIVQRMNIPIIKPERLVISPDSLSIQMDALVVQNRERPGIGKFYISPIQNNVHLKDFILPVGMIVVAAIASQTKNYRDIIPISRSNEKKTVTRTDDILQYSVAPSLFVMDIFEKEKHSPVDQFFLMSIAYGLTAIQVRNLKSEMKEDRPDGGTNSFPSGHTAVAFVGAHMIYKEFKDSNTLVAYSGYIVAGSVGALRMINNRHWFSDVVAGAGIAILSTELAYLIYIPVRNLVTSKINKILNNYFVVSPLIAQDELGLKFSIRF